MDCIDHLTLKEHILRDKVALDSYAEAQYRHRIAERVTARMDRKGLSYRELAATMGTSNSLARNFRRFG